MASWNNKLPTTLENESYERGDVTKQGGLPPIRVVPPKEDEEKKTLHEEEKPEKEPHQVPHSRAKAFLGQAVPCDGEGEGLNISLEETSDNLERSIFQKCCWPL